MKLAAIDDMLPMRKLARRHDYLEEGAYSFSPQHCSTGQVCESWRQNGTFAQKKDKTEGW